MKTAYFQTFDAQLARTLMRRGHPLIAHFRKGGKRIYGFPKSEELNEDVQELSGSTRVLENVEQIFEFLVS